MQKLKANYSASISELKASPGALLKEADGEPIVILNHNRTYAYLLPPETFEYLLELLDDIELEKLIEKRKHEKAVEVNLDEL